MAVLRSYSDNRPARTVIRQGGTVIVYQTSVPLDAAGEFDTARQIYGNEVPDSEDWIETGDIREVVVNVFADEASAVNGVVVETCINPDEVGTIVTASDDSLVADTPLQVITPINAPYWRFKFTNGAAPQTAFELSVAARR